MQHVTKQVVRLGLFCAVAMASLPAIPASATQVNTPPAIGYKGNEQVAHVTVNDKIALTIRQKQDADDAARQIAVTLNDLSFEQKLRADRMKPSLSKGKYQVQLDGKAIFSVTEAMAAEAKVKPQALTLKMLDQLRAAFGAKPYKTAQVSRGAVVGRSHAGYASWYGGFFHGRRTASGEVYNMGALTAAHRTLPFGTQALITNLDNGRQVVVRITDRGPFADPGRRIIDLSPRAFREIASLGQGVARIKVEALGRPR